MPDHDTDETPAVALLRHGNPCRAWHTVAEVTARDADGEPTRVEASCGFSAAVQATRDARPSGGTACPACPLS